jgi:hypothetical protein
VVVELTEGGGGGNTGRVVDEFAEGGGGRMEDSRVVGGRVGLARETVRPDNFIPGLDFSCDMVLGATRGRGRPSRGGDGYVSGGTEIVRLLQQGWLLL